jgi:hypothetical protein
MNLWFLAAVLTTIFRVFKVEPLGIKGLSWLVIAFCLILAGITALFSFGILGQILLVPVFIGLIYALFAVGMMFRLFGRNRY